MISENTKTAIITFGLLFILCIIIYVVTDGGKHIMEETDTKISQKFEVIDSGEFNNIKYCIIYDKDTGVEYYTLCEGSNKGTLMPLYDTDGKILLYGVGE